MASELSEAEALRALGDPTRLHIVEYLAGRCCAPADDMGLQAATAGEVCCHVSGEVKINSTISHHLHELEEAGLIRMNRDGRRVLCSANRPALKELADYLAKLAEGDYDACC
ncbi:MAG: helix-turn-helix transcriptional regulator [Fimbriimonas ginsengisoli]|uniref:Helix-turn-helix transcriptional regulator n=1 Tax=Fimbriimonas ginsengisoli TaxID=1005039 RepID=A0A931LUE8_FIMGI|nr:helix-turn-helix transcriptional regulator [Fimbriimonas ginsengisoli]MBI3743905.1 helix-turn-helix transcriptional regulator [Chloroflexota bacterium]